MGLGSTEGCSGDCRFANVGNSGCFGGCWCVLAAGCPSDRSVGWAVSCVLFLGVVKVNV